MRKNIFIILIFGLFLGGTSAFGQSYNELGEVIVCSGGGDPDNDCECYSGQTLVDGSCVDEEENPCPYGETDDCSECDTDGSGCGGDECDESSPNYLGDCDCFGIGCDDISIGGGNQQTGAPYASQTNDKFAKTNIPTTMPVQTFSTCVTSVFEYLSKICGDNIPRQDFEQHYYDSYSVNLMFAGVNYGNMNNFANQFFETSNFIGITQAIDAGYFLMTNVDGGNGDYHNVTIVGYHSNGDYIYMDPMFGNFREGPPSIFPKNYVVTIKDCK
jgi:hypothetical protein